jgi:hypothetical protein
MLHARVLGFHHPATALEQKFEVPAPMDFASAEAALEPMQGTAGKLP